MMLSKISFKKWLGLKQSGPKFAIVLSVLSLCVATYSIKINKVELNQQNETSNKIENWVSKNAYASELASQNPNVYVALAKKVVPSVVNITTTGKKRGGRGNENELFKRFFDDFFKFHGQRGFDGDSQGPGEPPEGRPDSRSKSMSLGTGFVIDSDGLILTNNHVVNDAEKIEVYFTEESSEKSSIAEIVGRDPELDIALIKVKTKKPLIPLSFGDSDALDVGEFVMAVGNPFGQGHSVTQGIISAKGRPNPEMPLLRYLQTDAAINPGNSGGPLINLRGEVIGINNAIDARAQGIGFAIPINLVKKVLPQLKSKGVVERGYIGVLIGDLSEDIAQQLGVDKTLKGAFVSHVVPGEAAENAGVKTYDVITSFNGIKIATGAELTEAVTSVSVGETVEMLVNRSGKEVKLSIKTSTRPNQIAGGPNGPSRNEGRDGKEKHSAQTVEKLQVIGIQIEEMNPKLANELRVPPETKGVVVTQIGYDSPADQAGVLRGDVITEVNKNEVANTPDFIKYIKMKKVNLLKVRRPSDSGKDDFLVLILDLKSS